MLDTHIKAASLRTSSARGASVACSSVFGPTLVTAAVAQPGGQRDCRGIPCDDPIVPAQQRVT